MPSSIDAKRLTRVALLTAGALALQYLEGLLPPLIPGLPVKLGLANVVVLFTLLRMRKSDALAVALLRCLLYALLLGGISGFFYALAGGLLSLRTMSLLLTPFRRERLSLPVLSAAGAFAFNAGQALVGFFVFGRAMLYYLPYLGLVSIPAGLITGFAASLLDRRLPAGRAAQP